MVNKKSSTRTPAAKESQAAAKTPRARKLSPEDLLKQFKAAQALLAAGKEKDPLRALNACGIGGTIILLGTQHLRAKRTIDWLKENFFPPETASVSSYFGLELTGENSLTHIKAALMSLSLFAKAELVVIYDADKVKAAVAHSLVEAVSRSHGSTLLVLTAEAANQKTVLINELQQSGTVVTFADLDSATLRRWIEKEVLRWNGPSGIDADAAELLIKSYGSDVSALAREISKLALLTPQGEKINRKLAEQLSLRTPEATSFALVTEMARKNAANCVALAGTLVEQGLHPLQVAAFLSRSFRTLLVQVEGGEGAALAPELQNAWFVRNLTPALRAFSTGDLKASLALLSKLDFQLKDSKLPETLVLSNTVQRIALRAWQ